MAFRRLRGRLDQMQGEVNFTLGMAQDLLEDAADGLGVTCIPTEGFALFATKVFKTFAKYLVAVLMHALKKFLPIIDAGPEPVLDLTWMEGKQVPFLVVIDPQVDVKLSPKMEMKSAD